MILGLMSDTHGRLEAARLAVVQLRSRGAEYLIHCGDVGQTGVIDFLAGEPAAFVWGNNDFDRHEGAKYAEMIGVRCLDDFGELELDGRRIAVTHGDNPPLLRRLLDAGRYDYLFTGHTHVPHDKKLGGTRWINPGALYRAAKRTVATLDLQTDTLGVWEV